MQGWIKFIKEQFGDKTLLFQTSSRSIQEKPANILDDSSTQHTMCGDRNDSFIKSEEPDLTHSFGNRLCIDDHETNTQANSIFTVDVELNWSAVSTKQQEQFEKEFKY